MTTLVSSPINSVFNVSNNLSDQETIDVSGFIPDGLTSVYLTNKLASFAVNGLVFKEIAYSLSFVNNSTSNIEKLIKEQKIAIIHTLKGRVQSISFHPSLELDVNIKRFVIFSSVDKCVLLSNNMIVRRCKEDQYRNLSSLILKTFKV